MKWILLVIAIVMEVTGTTCMKLSQGFTKLIPSTLMFIFYSLSFISLTFVLKKIDVSIAYAIWSGLGTSLIAIIGILWFREPATAIKIVSIGLIVIGIVGLNLSGSAH
jgi:small multidrug resistance pump